MTTPLTDQQLADIRAEFGPADWPSEILRLRALVAEMTRCRDNALAALYRDDVETDPHLPDLFADGLNGLYEWEDQPEPDQAPQELVDRCVRIVQPAFGKLTQERDSLRAADAAVLAVMAYYRDAPDDASRWAILSALAIARDGHIPQAIADHAPTAPCGAAPVCQQDHPTR